MADPINATEAQMKAMAEAGAVVECAYLTHLAGEGAAAASVRNLKRVTIADYARAIKALGARHFLLSSDLGQAGNPAHPDGLRAFIAGLRAEGIGDADLDLMTRKNPARLLGLEP
jgi:microsomal dipeptidase-like Zn-dependent dipeptidase